MSIRPVPIADGCNDQPRQELCNRVVVLVWRRIRREVLPAFGTLQGHLELQIIEDVRCPRRIENLNEPPVIARFARKNSALRREGLALGADSSNLNARAARKRVRDPLEERGRPERYFVGKWYPWGGEGAVRYPNFIETFGGSLLAVSKAIFCK